MITQKNIFLTPKKRGFHLVTGEILQKIGELPEIGLLNLFLRHTSAALSVNENYDPSVRVDMETIVDRLIPDGDSLYEHYLEGSDDMPAHFKSSMMGVSLTIPISGKKLGLGTWQGIYLCEFRNSGGQRQLTATIYS
ncbi:MAG: secondary thiamine-phosphate synthase enzyme YjbQ [Bacteroidales bacterium]|nr:secondary thiamine-phosphate synthase enzyme YjbQ [Bacteroidales bacterium]